MTRDPPTPLIASVDKEKRLILKINIHLQILQDIYKKY